MPDGIERWCLGFKVWLGKKGCAGWEWERTEGRVPPMSALKNLVLTEKDDLDEDKYSPQVKTSDFLHKDSKEL